jgi:hypothetical protein
MNPAERSPFVALALFAAVVVTALASPRLPAHPKKPKAAAVPLSLGDLITVNGATYQLQLLPSLVPVTPTPSPTPTPTPKPTLTGIRNRLTGLLVTSATAGTPLQLEGTLLGTAAGRLQLAGRIAAQPTSWTPTAIQFLAPDPGAAAVTGGWDVYQPVGNTYAIIASSGSFTLLPAIGPLPSPPVPLPLPGNAPLMVTGFRDAMGNLAQSFAPGSTIFIQGQGFGAVKGSVTVGVNPALVLTWTPTEISIRCPALDTDAQAGAVMLTVTSADGKQWDRLKGFSISGPGLGKVKF